MFDEIITCWHWAEPDHPSDTSIIDEVSTLSGIGCWLANYEQSHTTFGGCIQLLSENEMLVGANDTNPSWISLVKVIGRRFTK